MNEIVLLKQFGSITEAELTQNMLSEQGIKSMLKKNGLHYGGDLGDAMGAGLLVKQSDLQKALDILNVDN